MSRETLFRPEATTTQNSRWIGNILLIQPMSFKVYSTLALIFGLCLIMLLTFGEYTRRSTVVGNLVPDTGLIRITAPQSGIVTERLVEEGQLLEKQTVLYRISTEKQTEQGGLEQQLTQQVRLRSRLLTEEQNALRQLKIDEKSNKKRHLRELEFTLEKITETIDAQQERITLAQQVEQRYKKMFQNNLVSQDQYEQRIAQKLEQTTRLNSLEHERSNLKREINTIETELETLDLRIDNQISQLQREKASIEQELSMSEGRRQFQVLAPQSGVVTAPLIEIGQYVPAGKLLATVVPKDAKLIAHLYAPSGSAGFIKKGTKVMCRLHAFPYQKFGQLEGEVINVSRTALRPSELTSAPLKTANEFFYLVTVSLSAQEVRAYGEYFPLQAGMQLEADLLSETRKLYEWALEPLIGLSDKL